MAVLREAWSTSAHFGAKQQLFGVHSRSLPSIGTHSIAFCSTSAASRAQSKVVAACRCRHEDEDMLQSNFPSWSTSPHVGIEQHCIEMQSS